MSLEVSYSEARNNLASLMDQVTDDCEVVVIKRRGRSAVAMISADELSSLIETTHIFSSPRNAAKLMEAIKEVRTGGGEKVTIKELRKEFGIEKRKAK